MIADIRKALDHYDGEPGQVGYVLVIFNDDMSFSFDASITQSKINEEIEDEVIEAITELAEVLGLDDEGAELLQ